MGPPRPKTHPLPLLVFYFFRFPLPTCSSDCIKDSDQQVSTESHKCLLSSQREIWWLFCSFLDLRLGIKRTPPKDVTGLKFQRSSTGPCAVPTASPLWFPRRSVLCLHQSPRRLFIPLPSLKVRNRVSLTCGLVGTS